MPEQPAGPEQTGQPDQQGRGPARDRSFAPTVLLGLGGAGLTALACSRTWAASGGDAAGLRVHAEVTGSQVVPLATALSLVALAAWGVVLVVRGRARQLVAALGLLAAVGTLVAIGFGIAGLDAAATSALHDKGGLGGAGDVDPTGWVYLAPVTGLAAVAAYAVALRRARRWPAMGSKYDAPAARAAEPASEQDLWRALDEGRDPTQ